MTKLQKAEKIVRQLRNIPDEKDLNDVQLRFVRKFSRMPMAELNDLLEMAETAKAVMKESR
jgi:CRISPR/Cas system-associated protein Csm6